MAQSTIESAEAGTRASRVKEIIRQTGSAESALIPILQKVQEEYRYLPEDALEAISKELDLPTASICGVATFYAQFSLEPKGKHIVRVCDGTACHVRDNRALIDGVRNRLALGAKQSTTLDARFTLEIVNCIGACALAPAVVIDEQVHGQQTAESMKKLIDAIDAKDKEEEA
jgi:NADH-quinone oxidoreductase subunit E